MNEPGLTRTMLLCVVLCSLAGCPASMPGLDGGTDDVGSGTDTPGPDPDAGLEDGDGDGVADPVDCDPDDEAVGATGTRACTDAECGAGTQECEDGVWAACVPAVDCRCDTEGMRRLVPCERCGEVAETCTSGRWERTSACLGGGPCELGDVDTRMGELCQVDQRLCGADCQWGEYTNVHPRGTCIPGSGLCTPFDAFPTDWICDEHCQQVDDPCCPPMVPPLPECR